MELILLVAITAVAVATVRAARPLLVRMGWA